MDTNHNNSPKKQIGFTYEQYLDAFTTLYIKLADFLIIKENHIVKISIKLSKLSNDINNLIKPIT